MSFNECQNGFCLDCPGQRARYRAGEWDPELRETPDEFVDTVVCGHGCHEN